MSDIKPCPFCGAENPRADSHADDCYFTLHRALNNAPEADLSLTFDVIEAWNRRAALQANVPDGWKSIAVTGFDDLIMALDRAYSKGYMPDAIEKYYEPFDHCALSSAPPVAQPAPNIAQIATDHGRRAGNLWHFDDLALSIFASKVMGLVSLRAQPAERNQCDGCRRGLPIKGGLHTGPGMWDKMVCQAHKYGIGD